MLSSMASTVLLLEGYEAKMALANCYSVVTYMRSGRLLLFRELYALLYLLS